MTLFPVGTKVRVIQNPAQVGIVARSPIDPWSQATVEGITNRPNSEMIAVQWSTVGDSCTNLIPYPTLIWNGAVEAA